MSKAKFGLDVIPGKNLIVTLSLAGSIDQEELPELKNWATNVKNRIREAWVSANKKVAVLVDLTELKNYTEPEAMTTISDLMTADSEYVSKTAVFGASKMIGFAQEIATSLSGRENMKSFETKEKAIAWLSIG